MINQAQNSRNVQDGKRVAVTFLKAATSAAFAITVSIVIGYRSKKKMIGFYASRVVTSMQYALTLRDALPIVNFPRIPMGANVRAFSYIENSVAVFIGGASPIPALRSFFNLIPESGKKWYFWSSHDLNLRNRLGLWLGSLVAEYDLRATSILPRKLVAL